MTEKMKKVLIITTGGTIASTEEGNGLTPTMTGEEILDLAGDCRRFADLTCHAVMSLDSTNIQPEDWLTIAGEIKKQKDAYDGFVVLHGTDTMAYSAAAVSFMTMGIGKPVIYTGSQIPISKPGSDALRNVNDAVYAAAESGLPGVYLVMNGKIMNGCSVSKTNTFSLDAFSSVNTGDVGEVASYRDHIRIDHIPQRDAGGYPWRITISPAVLLMKLYPGADPEILKHISFGNYRAVILEAFGAGGIPALERSFLPEIRMLYENGILPVITSQCLNGASDISIYEVGKNAAELGAVAAGPIVSDVLVSKMMWAVSVTDDPEELKRILAREFCGEFGSSQRA